MSPVLSCIHEYGSMFCVVTYTYRMMQFVFCPQHKQGAQARRQMQAVLRLLLVVVCEQMATI